MALAHEILSTRTVAHSIEKILGTTAFYNMYICSFTKLPRFTLIVIDITNSAPK